MKIKFFNPNDLDRNIKATVHKTGKIGFTVDAAKKLSLSTDCSLSIGMNEDDADDSNLYVMLHNTIETGAFKISKAGGYYYVNTKVLFDNLKIDYVNSAIIYDITEEIFEGQKVYKFKKRNKLNKDKNIV
jgi:hypothetical protein